MKKCWHKWMKSKCLSWHVMSNWILWHFYFLGILKSFWKFKKKLNFYKNQLSYQSLFSIEEKYSIHQEFAIMSFFSIIFIYRDFRPTEIVWENDTYVVCQMGCATWVVESIGEDLYFSSYYLFRVVFVNLLPCIALIVLNILLFRAMKHAQKKRKKLFDKCCKSKRANDKNCTTLMLIIVVSVFLLVEFPLAIITALHVISSVFRSNFLDYRFANLCILLLNFFLILSYPVNFALYCGMSRQFRETFRDIFCGRRINENGNVTNILGGSRKQHDASSRYSMVNLNGPKTNTTNETVL